MAVNHRLVNKGNQEKRTINQLSEERIYGWQQLKHPIFLLRIGNIKINLVQAFEYLGRILPDNRKYNPGIKWQHWNSDGCLQNINNY